MGGAPPDDLKRTLADQSVFRLGFNGILGAFCHASGCLGTAICRLAATRGAKGRQELRKSGLQMTAGARMVFGRQPPSPEVCICVENIIDNRLLAREPLSPIWCKLAPKRLPEGGLGRHFGGPGPSRRPRQRENGGSEKLSEHFRKKTSFHGRAGSETGDG